MMVSALTLESRLLESRFVHQYCANGETYCSTCSGDSYICTICRFATRRLRTTSPRKTLDQPTLPDLGPAAASSAGMASRRERWQYLEWKQFDSIEKKDIGQKSLTLSSGDLLQENRGGWDRGAWGGRVQWKEARAWRALLQRQSLWGCRLDCLRFEQIFLDFH